MDMSNKICHRKRTSNIVKTFRYLSIVICKSLAFNMKSKLIQVQTSSKVARSIQLYISRSKYQNIKSKIAYQFHKNTVDLTGDLHQVNLQGQDLKLNFDYRQRHESIDITGLTRVAQLPNFPINISHTRQTHNTAPRKWKQDHKLVTIILVKKLIRYDLLT